MQPPVRNDDDPRSFGNPFDDGCYEDVVQLSTMSESGGASAQAEELARVRIDFLFNGGRWWKLGDLDRTRRNRPDVRTFRREPVRQKYGVVISCQTFRVGILWPGVGVESVRERLDAAQLRNRQRLRDSSTAEQKENVIIVNLAYERSK